MRLSAGNRLGPYEILAPLGAGGMGEVYKAKDTRLDRFVAVKVLPDRFTDSAEALSRFEREARLVAALNHPSIVGIFDVGRAGDTAYAVMELLKGESLRARLSGGPLPPRKATELAIQIAEGLAAAHEKGVLHRDLKPENLWVTTEGRLKILDFGLAKQVTGHEAAENSLEPTASQAVALRTKTGRVLGTPAYMSPEQLRGESADVRSDIFSFGMVLFELLTGRRPFARGSASDTMAAILRDDPEEDSLVAAQVPAGLRRVVLHCLEKSPGRRFQSARDLGFALEAAMGDSGSRPHTQTSTSQVSGAIHAPRSGGSYLPLGTAGLLGLALGLGLAFLLRPAPELPGVVTIRMVTYSGHDTSPAVSPDGRTVAFTSDRDGRPRIWLKQLKGGAEKALTDGSDDFPRFSPDGASILFAHSQGGKSSLFRTPVLGNDPHKIVDDVESADWSPDGKQIAFSRILSRTDRILSTLFLIDADGGVEKELAHFEGRLTGFPRWSPDGRHIMLVTPPWISSGVIRKFYLVDAKDGTYREMLPPPPVGMLSSGVWISPEELFFLKSESITGGGVSVSPARGFHWNIRTSQFRPLFWIDSSGVTADLLQDGRVLFDSMSGRQNLREYDLEGKSPPHWITHGTVNDRQPEFGPEHDTVVFSSNRSGNLDIWSISTGTGVVRSITDDPADDWDPSFTPDGRSILWSSNRSGNLEIWSCNSDGTGVHQVTHDGEDAQNPTQSKDGRWIVYSSANRAHQGIWRIHPDGTGAEILVSGAAQIPQISPDGLYATYVISMRSNTTLHVLRLEDKTDSVYATFPELKRKTFVFPGRARWMPDGKRLLFIGQDEHGRDGIFIQDFVFGKDTTATRHPLAGFDPDWITESVGVSNDGKRLVLSESERVFSLMIAEGVPGLKR
jgi:eukaryotic-like serine/threonine-protein kinase